MTSVCCKVISGRSGERCPSTSTPWLFVNKPRQYWEVPSPPHPSWLLTSLFTHTHVDERSYFVCASLHALLVACVCECVLPHLFPSMCRRLTVSVWQMPVSSESAQCPVPAVTVSDRCLTSDSAVDPDAEHDTPSHLLLIGL